MQSFEDLARWRAELESLDDGACLFRHHLGDTDVKAGKLCDGDIQDRTHGCAHAFHYKLLEVIQEMSDVGIIEPTRAEKYGVEIRQGKNSLFREDTLYQLEPMTTGEIAQMELKQTNIINRRVQITQEVLKTLDALAAEHSMSV